MANTSSGGDVAWFTCSGDGPSTEAHEGLEVRQPHPRPRWRHLPAHLRTLTCTALAPHVARTSPPAAHLAPPLTRGILGAARARVRRI